MGEYDCWRIIDGSVEHLVSEINIEVPSKTSRDEIEGVGLKYHIVCEGVLTLADGIATITGVEAKL